MAKGGYDIAGMRSAAGKIESYMSTYADNKKKIIELVQNTTSHTDDPIIRNYLEKFENLETDMESVQNLMETYANYLKEAAKTIEAGTSPQYQAGCK